MWIYKSPIGTIKIMYSNTNQAFYIIIDNDYYGLYQSAVAAADDVFTFSTGCYKWDKHCVEMQYQLYPLPPSHLLGGIIFTLNYSTRYAII